MGLLDAGGGIYLTIGNQPKLIRPLANDTVTVRTRSIPSVKDGPNNTVRSFRPVTIDGFYGQHFLDKNPDPLWHMLEQKDQYNRNGDVVHFPFRMLQLLPVWSYSDHDVRILKQGNQLFDGMISYLKSIQHYSPEERAARGLFSSDWAVYTEKKGSFEEYKSTRQDSSQFTAADVNALTQKIQAMMQQALDELDPFKGDMQKLAQYVQGNFNRGQGQQQQLGGRPQQQQQAFPAQQPQQQLGLPAPAQPQAPVQGGSTPIGFGQALPGMMAPPPGLPAAPPAAPAPFAPAPAPYQPPQAPPQAPAQVAPAPYAPPVQQPINGPQGTNFFSPPTTGVAPATAPVQITSAPPPQAPQTFAPPVQPQLPPPPPATGGWGALQGFGGTPGAEQAMARLAPQGSTAVAEQPRPALAPVSAQPVFAPPPQQAPVAPPQQLAPPPQQPAPSAPVQQAQQQLSDPGDLLMPPGKHAGKTLRQVYAEEPTYVNFVRNQKKELRQTIDAFLATVQPQSAPAQAPTQAPVQQQVTQPQQQQQSGGVDRNALLKEINQLAFSIPELSGANINNLVTLLVETVGSTEFNKMSVEQLQLIYNTLLARRGGFQGQSVGA